MPLFEVRPEYLAAAWNAVDRGYGGMAGFLRDGLGITDEEVSTLQRIMLYAE